MAKDTDKYVNILAQRMTQAAANTLEFTEIDIGLSLFDRVGLKVQRLEYELSSATYGMFDSDGDIVEVGLSSSNQISSLSFDQRALVHKCVIVDTQQAGNIGNWLFSTPFVFDFSTLGGGGLLIPPKPLYGAINSASIATTVEGFVRIFFTIEKLTDADYLELVESYRFYG